MPRKLRFSYPYIEDFGGKTRLLLDSFEGMREGWTAFNPSIGFSPALGYGITVRSSNYKIDKESGVLTVDPNLVENELWFSELNDDLNLTNLRKLEVIGDIELANGIEDARLVGTDTGWSMLAVVFETYGGVRRTRLAVFAVDPEANTVTHIETLHTWDTSRSEKNWMPLAFGTSENFDYVYSPTGTYKNGEISLRAHNNHLLSDIRGGSQLWPLGDGTYLAVTHSVYYQPVILKHKTQGNLIQVQHRTYTHQFARMNAYGQIIEVSEEFFLDGPDVEFVAGLVEKDGNFIISYGREDEASHLAVIPKENALATLTPVED
jgi:predicted GH43/DUF377 family glycosyl hydrolase